MSALRTYPPPDAGNAAVGISAPLVVLFYMELFVNHQPIVFNTGSSVADLLSQLQKPNSGLAVAIGERIIPKSDWERTVLKEQDRITIISATQGG